MLNALWNVGEQEKTTFVCCCCYQFRSGIESNNATVLIFIYLKTAYDIVGDRSLLLFLVVKKIRFKEASYTAKKMLILCLHNAEIKYIWGIWVLADTEQ